MPKSDFHAVDNHGNDILLRYFESTCIQPGYVAGVSKSDLDRAGISRPDMTKKDVWVGVQSLPDLGYSKCPRCWKYHSCSGNYMVLCDGCCRALMEGWPDHECIPYIRQAYAEQYRKFKL